MWKKILVPHDFSECASTALDVAADLALTNGASIVLLHVSPLPPNLPPWAMVTPPGEEAPMRVDEYTTKGAQAELEALAAKLCRRGIDTRVMALATASGDVAHEIVRVAGEEASDAIVVGTHGRTGLAHFLLGSVAEKVIRRSKVPVVTIRGGCAEGVEPPTAEEARADDELAG